MKEYKSENFAREQPESLMSSDWEEKLKESPIDLIEEKQAVTIEELKENYSGRAAVIDAYVKDIEEKGKWDGDALRINDIINIDHHAPLEKFERNISSVNLAIEWVKKNGTLEKNYPVVINHMDCDSVLAALIIRGILPPDEKFAAAAVAADHTGEENEIADLLQALEDKRDLDFSARNLKLLLDGKDLEAEAKELLEKRHADREKAKDVVEEGRITKLGGVSYTVLDKKVESAFFPALITDAQVILVFSPHEKNPDRWEAKIRLGMAAPRGLTLHKLEINDFDPNFGSRWNAGSDRRAGGTDLNVQEYAEYLNEKLQKFLEDKNQ